MLRFSIARLSSLPVVLSLLAVLIGVIAFLEVRRARRGSRTRAEWFALIALIVSCLAVYFVLTLAGRKPLDKPQFLPSFLESYRRAFSWLGGLHIADRSSARMILLNILAYTPLGLMLPCALSGRQHPYGLTLAAGAGLSVLTEVLQYFARLGYAEADDVINNTLGTLLGMAIVAAMRRLIRMTAAR